VPVPQGPFEDPLFSNSPPTFCSQTSTSQLKSPDQICTQVDLGLLAIMSATETITQHPAITAENVLRLFPEVNTSLIGGSHNSATNDNALEGYDEEQIRLMDEVCIVLDENDLPIGSATKKLCM
jgi:hypothetical protein